MKRVLVIPGDGIGPEIIPPCVDIVSGLASDISFEFEKAGKTYFEDTGESISEGAIQKARSADAILFGATATSRNLDYLSPILRLRRELDLFANVRPIKNSFPDQRGIDIVIIRENSEGLYTGREERDPEGVTTFRRVTEKASRRIIDFAFSWCREHSIKKLTCVHKSNVLKMSDGLFLDIFLQRSEEYGEIESSDIIVDAAAMKMVMAPDEFQGVVTLNLYGDILSDLAAGLAGGLGFMASVNFGDRRALFEPVHGAALDIAGKGMANPVGALRCCVMMLDWLGYSEEANLLKNGIEKSIAEDFEPVDRFGRCRTANAFKSLRKYL